ncbi:(5-formylfuran-3-yl)methyl phosphate transaminase [Candidatus Desulfarcum epimagneticum]|uniref:Aminotransferase n=1 Tax=uncultured Desulfobacteraceae bacterium TaxID=218296 RepID=A0A484HI34_9BACT|nr:(5-formylfuran-3-yl)methyl phosphate transaminase [uncultured Desulfobacteraceae bacterium]
MISKKARHISPFIVMDVLEKAHEMEKKGADVIHLEVGEPDFDAPECVKEAARDAIDRGDTHYTHSLGIPELRQAICDMYQKKYNVAVDPDQVAVTSGTSPAMALVFGALLDPGDEVIISDPHYACYPNFIRFMGGRPAVVPVDEDDGFQYRPEAIKEKISEKTRGIFINSPSNPTGNLLSAERMKAIAGMTDPGSLYVISDEIYHGLVYQGTERSILEFTENAFVLNGFSKAYAMTGLRLGYVIAPEAFMGAIRKIQQNFFISANSVMQRAGIAALKHADDDVTRMRNVYDKRRKYMIGRLKKMGLGISTEPTGAFYVFANVRHISGDSYRLAFDILEKARVGVAPGIDFGQNAEGYLRFSYASSMENIARAMDRLDAYFKDR